MEDLKNAANKPVNFLGINHLALVTDDMDKTVRFYRDVLGMPVVATIGNYGRNNSFRHYFFKIGPANTIAFFEWPGIVPGPSKPAGVPVNERQFDHVSFNVADEEALLDLQARLRAHEVEVTRVVDHNFIHSIYFDDPNGISLEASYWLVDVEKNPVFGDSRPVDAIREEQAEKVLS